MRLAEGVLSSSPRAPDKNSLSDEFKKRGHDLSPLSVNYYANHETKSRTEKDETLI
jgi:hypothetical protein